MAIKSWTFRITTDSSGDWTETRDMGKGKLVAYRYEYGNMDTGADLDIEGAGSGWAYVDHDNLGTSSLDRMPRGATHAVDGSASLRFSGEPYEELMYVTEPLVITISNGGNAKTGTLYIWIDEEV